NEPAWGRVEIEGVAMPDSLTLLYFKGIPFTCTARPAPGYRFAGWHGLSASGEKSIRLTLTDPGRLIAIFTPEAVAVEEEGGGAPAHFSLLQNYPNPFNPVTTISFDLARPELVTLKIYDLRGSEMATLLHQRLEPGRHSARFDASALANGVYFYRLEAGSFRQVRKMVLAK
ncbi:MAG TPA: T9SS type A sorting domain-containing protein, partial [bacterium]|nr:T9SS type A sorting domain-containing protein [bacterium]